MLYGIVAFIFGELPHLHRFAKRVTLFHSLSYSPFSAPTPVRKCLQAIRFILPKEAAMKVGKKDNSGLLNRTGYCFTPRVN